MDASLEKMVDPTLAEMGKNLNEAMKMLEDNQRKVEEENEKKYARKDIPGPLQGRYENGSAYYHEDDREGLLKICRLVIHTRYEDYTVEGFNVLYTKQPVIYISSAARTGLGQALCNQDVALLDRVIKDDVDSGKLPLLLVANAVLGTEIQDVDQLVDCLKMKIPVLTSTLQLREEFEQEVRRTVGLLYIEDLSWPGLGVVRYNCHSDGKNDDKQEKELEKINTELLKKLNELESDLTFSLGPEFGGQKNCVYIGMVTEDLDVSELVETIAATGREIEENSRLLENMTEVVRKGIQEAQLQLQKANEERLLEEGLLRQIPVVGSVLNWFSPFQASPKGRTFNLTAGSLESTESTYVSKAQGTGTTPPPTPTSSLAKQRLPGQKIFKRSVRSSDTFSETSSVSHCDDLEKVDPRPPALSPGQEQGPQQMEKTEEQKELAQATQMDTEGTQSDEPPRHCTKAEEGESQR
ncbi:pyridoxal-dependent decarboxylase domain-containing protein 1 [Grus japonensis]|uniref:Pyridoxal-dependent decarboxylase domain-containing protein 1 n=1 Tax=Grus japonensis TaxID=30415 RepID=A0ABC9XHG3_GRUJA